MIKYSLNMPNFGTYSDINILMKLAKDAEEAGWDGFFLWDHMYLSSRLERNNQFGESFTDPWIALTAIATVTTKIKIGTYVTPLPRRRPWKLAREIVSLDRLSKGRLILGIGLGNPNFEYEGFGEEENLKIRSQKCDEGLEILEGLLSGNPFSYDGNHYKIKEVIFKPKPFNKKIPIWIAGRWPYKNPFKRAAKYDGVCPICAKYEGSSPRSLYNSDVEEIIFYIKKFRKNMENYDIIIAGKTPIDKIEAKKIIEPYIDVGATWWSETINDWRGPYEEMLKHIIKGPPKT